jgi:hypothetical protein
VTEAVLADVLERARGWYTPTTALRCRSALFAEGVKSGRRLNRTAAFA